MIMFLRADFDHYCGEVDAHAHGRCPIALKERRRLKPGRTKETRKLATARVIVSRVVTSFAGFFLIVYGAIAVISPLPAGAPLMIIGLLMLALANPSARPIVRRLRRRFRWFDGIVRKVAGRGKGDMKALLEETDPARKPD